MKYDKYDKQVNLHWEWYKDEKHWYRELVDDALAPFMDQQEGQSLVDVGCGDGLPASILSVKGFRVCGIDPSHKAMEYAQDHAIIDYYYIETAEQFAKRKQKFDYLFCLNTIEHMDDPNALVEIMKGVKKFGIIVTDNAMSHKEKDPYHLKEFNISEFRELFKDFDLQPIKITNPEFFGFKVTNK